MTKGIKKEGQEGYKEEVEGEPGQAVKLVERQQPVSGASPGKRAGAGVGTVHSDPGKCG